MNYKDFLKRLYPLLLILLVFIVWKYRESKKEELQMVEISGTTMGTIGYSVKYFNENGFNYGAEIDSLLKVWNLSLSTYIPTSEISRFNSGDSCFHFESEYFLPVLEASKQVFEKSDGAFDPTVGPIVNAWGFGPDKSMVPDSSRVDSLKVEKSDSLYIIKSGQEADTLDNSYVGEFVKRGQDFNSLDAASRNEKISKSFSYAVFLLLPLFALYLGLFFKKKRRHYLENIIFSLHFHAFYFIAGMFFLFFDRLLPGDIDTLILISLVCIYLFFAVKRFYDFSWLATVFRFLGLIVLYSITVWIVLLASILISLFI